MDLDLVFGLNSGSGLALYNSSKDNNNNSNYRRSQSGGNLPLNSNNNNSSGSNRSEEEEEENGYVVVKEDGETSRKEIKTSLSVHLLTSNSSATNSGSNSGNSSPQPDEYWQTLFVQHIIQSTPDENSDDMIFFVQKSPMVSKNSRNVDEENILLVRRKTGKQDIQLSEKEAVNVRWKETFYLNVLVQLQCYLTVAICTKTVNESGKTVMNTISHVTKRVHPSPYKTRMDLKGAKYACSFPLIYFNVEDFEDAFSNVIINENEYFCVEIFVCLPPKNPGELDRKITIFQGAVPWTALSGTFANHHQYGRFDQVEYIMMKGPHGKGHAQVAVSIPGSFGSSSDDLQRGTGTLTNTAKSLFNRISQTIQQIQNPTPLTQLRCWLTFVNVTWQSIVTDIRQSISQRTIPPLKFPDVDTNKK